MSNAAYSEYNCLSLYEMLRFHSIFFFHFIEGLTSIEHELRSRLPHENLSSGRFQSWQGLVGRMLSESEQIGLRTVPAYLKRLLASSAGGRLTNAELVSECATAKSIIQAELSHHLLFVIPQRDADLFSDEPLLGNEVYERFPSARHDIAEAAKALALDRSTAAVLHLMRVLEVGLNALAGYLRIPYKHTNWEIVINQIPTRIKEIESKQRKPKDWRNMRQFLAETGSDFRLLKDAFRNWAMHIHVTYDDRAAREIFEGTKAFMRHLSTKLKE